MTKRRRNPDVDARSLERLRRQRMAEAEAAARLAHEARVREHEARIEALGLCGPWPDEDDELGPVTLLCERCRRPAAPHARDGRERRALYCADCREVVERQRMADCQARLRESRRRGA